MNRLVLRSETVFRNVCANVILEVSERGDECRDTAKKSDHRFQNLEQN